MFTCFSHGNFPSRHWFCALLPFFKFLSIIDISFQMPHCSGISWRVYLCIELQMPFQNLAQFLLMTPYIITLEQRRGCTTKFNNEEVVQVPSYYTWYNFRLSRKIIGEPSATPIFDLLLHNLGLVTPHLWCCWKKCPFISII